MVVTLNVTSSPKPSPPRVAPTDAPTVAIETHGCKLNQADSDTLARQFVEAGYRLASANDPADVYVLNSCTVTHVADRKARHSLRAARRRNPQATIIATGCYAQRSPEDLRLLDEVDIVAGNTDKATLVQMIADERDEALVPSVLGDEAVGIGPGVLKTRAMVKIQEGCDQVCAYCIVPKVRGRERSIPPEALTTEINRHVASGYKEIVLTGTQLGSYGFDLEGTSLAKLLKRILSETDVVRLRVSSLQPQEIDEELLDLWSDSRLCPHFHIPLQSGSAEVLKRMRRRYTRRGYRDAVELVRQGVPDVAITADVIAGFPGETAAEFEETFDICEEMAFADAHVFPYSPRPGTSAAYLNDRVAPQVKSERVRRLLGLVEAQARQFRKSILGGVRPVLWETTRTFGGQTRWSGLTDNYVRVVAPSDRELTNCITQARLLTQEEDLVIARVL